MIEIFIQKPIYSNFVYIYDKYLKQAERNGDRLHIKTPKGEIVCTPEQWRRQAKIMKKVFKRPNEPMTLIGNYVPISIDKRQQRLI